MKHLGLIFSLVFLCLFGCGKETAKSSVAMSIISDKVLVEKEVIIEKNKSYSRDRGDLHKLYKELQPNLVSTCNLYNFLMSRITTSSETTANLDVTKTMRSTSGVFTETSLEQIHSSILNGSIKTYTPNMGQTQENITTSYKNSLAFYELMRSLSPNSGKVIIKITETTNDKKVTEIKNYDVTIKENKLSCNTTDTTETKR